MPDNTLAAFLKAQRRRTGKRAPIFTPTAAQERKFERLIGRLIKEWSVVLNTDVLPAYGTLLSQQIQASNISVSLGTESLVDRLDSQLQTAANRVANYAESLSPELRLFLVEFADWHRGKLISSMRVATGVDLSPMLSLSETNGLMRAATVRNVSLIKGLNADMTKRVTNAVVDSFNQRYQIKALRKRLVEDLKFAPGRAKIIAQDQIGKYTNELDRFRHEQLGIKKYIWRTVGDDRVRPTHAALEGEVIAWDKPPAIGHPGTDINCRCRPEAYLEE